ncbi:DUF418 domain-containing protein [Paenibacillus polysaccharolyticus]|uniref:DUF418 domain-containing protein n=1 Tax=Paenibacillus TaxID=44249 RepID=UPI00280BE16D|nr:DUF418 domain-containing protein [Paenibacillus polysaccharolyticus]
MNSSKNRVQLIDGLRGFSLIGIVLANMLAFQYGMFGQSEPQLLGIDGADRTLHSLLLITVVGSFMPIFAFMFGFGMIKLAESLESRDLRPKYHLARRFLLLLVIGILHITYLWEGDILTIYGVLGFFLLLFLNRNPKTLFILALMLLTGVGLLDILKFNPMNPIADVSTHMESYIIQSQNVFGNGSYTEIRDFSNSVSPFGGESDKGILLLALVLAPLMTLPMFLLGMRAARIGTFNDPLAMRSMYIRRALFLLPIGLLLKVYSVLRPKFNAEDWLCIEFGSMLGGILLALGYIYLFALLYSVNSRASIFVKFEAVGRLSLTNYLMQSVICTTIYYGYGLGLFGRAGVFAGVIIALSVYGIQLLFSHLYLKKFSSGPVEYVLRIGTYMSLRGKPRKKE